MHGKLTIKSRCAATILVVALLSLLPQCADAQSSGKGHELRLGFAGGSVGAVLSQGIGCDRYEVCPPSLSTEDRYSDAKGRTVSAGILILQYSYNINRRVSVGVNFGYDLLFARRYDGYTREPKGLVDNFGLSVYPAMRLVWNPDRTVKVFTDFGLGVGVAAYYNVGDVRSSDLMSYVPIFQFSPVGISFGRKVFGFAEISLGTLYTGGRAGIGYKF